MVYASCFYPTLNSHMLVLRSTCVVHVAWHHFSRTFYTLLYIIWLVTVSFDVTNVWQHDLVTLSLTLVLKIEDGKENQKENENRKEKKRKINYVYCFHLWHYLAKKRKSSNSTKYCMALNKLAYFGSRLWLSQC